MTFVCNVKGVARTNKLFPPNSAVLLSSTEPFIIFQLTVLVVQTSNSSFISQAVVFSLKIKIKIYEPIALYPSSTK